MDAASDEELARLLQFQFDSETASEIADVEPVSSSDRRSSGTKPIGIVDERWELIDPNPDVRALFLQFNDQFFWGRLAGVEVRWSPRMTLCAGLCCYEGYGGLCSIRLSQPLLKLRPRKDLVETLLHEMIHAYLFVTQNNKDHDGHGPEFCKHMNRINSATGTNISIYHTFHDEVDSYRQHWWRCDGPCRQRKPYFGYVKRSMNRAPSARDPWWGEHQRSCGGTYTKIKEPEGYGQKKGGKKKGDEGEGSKESNETKDKPGKLGVDIRNFIPFSGKGQTLGRPATSTSSVSSNTSPLSGLSTSSGSTTSSAISDRHGGQAKERKRSSDSKDISSFFTKKDSNQSTSTANSTSNYVPPHLPNSSSSENGFQKKPRFTPVVATASGRVVDTNEFDLAGEKFRNNGQTTKRKDSESAIPSKTGRFTPVVAPVGRKGSIHETKIPGESSSSSKGAKGVDTVGNCRDKSNNKDLPSFSKTVSTRRADGERTSSEINKKKRARLVDLQAIFDSDSDEEEGMNRSSKCPRYSHDKSGEEDDAILVDDVSRRASASSNKENSPALHQNLLNEDRGDVYIHDDSDNDDVVARPTGNEINTGIWKDLSHLSSGNSGSQVDGDRRFGRVTPPLWGKSKRKTNPGINVHQTPPQSSFCEHPWQTAARESGKKAISGRTGEVINLLAEDDDGGLVEQVGPKTVPCPVCNLQIEEKKINSHLDTCLTFNCDALFSP